MAYAAKICTLLLLAAQAQLMLVGTAPGSSSSEGGGGCIRRVDEVSNKYGSCQCYRKCSDPEEGWLTNAASQRCFVDCVLRHGCVCPGDGDTDDGVPPNVGKVVDPPAEPPPSMAPPPPPVPPPPKVVVDPPTPATPKVVNPLLPKSKPPGAATTTTTTMVERYYCDGFCVANPVPGGFPVLMDGTTLRVTVPRPKVSRSRIEKEQEEETLVVEVSFVAGESDTSCMFIVQVYTELQRAVQEDKLIGNGVQFDVALPILSDEDARNGRSVQKFPIGDRLEYMGADGHKTIVVLLLQPRKVAEGFLDVADIYNKYKLTIRDVRIEYERKAS